MKITKWMVVATVKCQKAQKAVKSTLKKLLSMNETKIGGLFYIKRLLEYLVFISKYYI